VTTADWRTYRLLVGLLGTLSERREVTGQIALDRAALGKLSVMLVVLGGLFSLWAMGRPQPSAFLMGSIAVSAFLLLPMLVSEAAEALMNPAEAFVLAHQPVRGGAYLAAKATHLAYAVARVVVSFNAIPAAAGLLLPGTKWYYPLTHLTATLLCGVFVALAICGLFGALFQVLPIARLKNAAQWVQLIVTTLFILGPQIRLPARFLTRWRLDLNDTLWSAVPTTWFTALGLVGQGSRPLLEWKIAGPAMLVSALLIGAGVRALSSRYMTRVVLLLRSRPARRPARGGHWLGDVARGLTGGPAGRAGFAFVGKMAARDWQFRRLMMQGPTLRLAVLLVPLAVRTGVGTPFGGRARVDVAAILPHLLGLSVLYVASVIDGTDRHRAAWTFLTSPMSRRPFARGVYLALWMAFVAAPFAILIGPTLWLWGIGDAVLFTVYGLAVTSAYLSAGLFAVRGLPFASPPKVRQASNAATAIGQLIVIGALVGIQALWILRSRQTTAVAAIVSAGAAYALGRRSVAALADRIDRDLVRLSPGRARMFTTISEADEPAT
jgi:hypothetical protein